MYGIYKITLMSAMVAACSVLLTTAITAEPRSTPKAGPLESIVLPTSSKGVLSQCGDYFTYSPESIYYGVVPDDYTRDTIPVPLMNIPVFGYMVDKEFPVDEAMKVEHGKNPYTMAEINRALWEGHTFIWLSPETTPETFAYIHDYATKLNKVNPNRVIPLTFTGDITSNPGVTRDGRPIGTKTIPLGREFGFSSWNISQSCMSFSEATFEEFLEHSKQHNVARKIEPVPEATLQADGSLPRVHPTN